MSQTSTGQELYSDRMIEGLTANLAPIRKFSLDFSNEAKQAGKTVNVPLISADAVTAFNASSSNFSRAAYTKTEIPLTFGAAYIAGFSLTADDLLNFRPSFWTGKADLDMRAICDSVLADVVALITAGNYGDADADKATVTLAGFGRKSIAAVRAKAVAKKLRLNRCTLVLNPDFFSALLGDLDANVYGGKDAIVGGAIPGLLGFAQVVEFPQLTGPGFIAQSDAIAIASRAFKPATTAPYEAIREIVEPETGFTCTYVELGDGASGNLSVSVTGLVKSAVGNSSALLRLV
jgi:hypothetical protein